MKNKVWDKLTTIQKRLALIVSVVIAVSYLYPRVISVAQYVSGVIKFQNQRDVYEKQLKMLINYIEVDKGLAKAQMEKIDSIERYVLIEIDGKLKELKVDIRKNKSGDYKIFVNDENVGVYATYLNHSINQWEYYDFNNNHHVTYTK